MLYTLPQALRRFKDGKLSEAELLEFLKELPYQDLEFAKIDHHRSLRHGFAEVVFGRGKTSDQTFHIARSLLQRQENVLVTGSDASVHERLKELAPEAQFFPDSGIIAVHRDKAIRGRGTIGVISAGTADIPVAEEAAVTAQVMGNQTFTSYDCGVAGVHRLLSIRGKLDECTVLIIVAGMEGALPSVVGGLVECPVIAVPTSVGYGAALGGIAALLGMLNSCSPNIAVVNIDNGFGAGYVASLINRSPA